MPTRAKPPEEHHPPTREALRAAALLIGDGDPEVAGAAREWLLRCGERARTTLVEVAEHSDVKLRLRARALVRALDLEQLLHRFGCLDLDQPSTRRAIPLLEGAVLASHMVRTFSADADELRVWLRSEAEVLRERFKGRSRPVKARLLAERLHGENGLRGCSDDASARGAAGPVDQVLLDRVLSGGVGVPVTLSMIYLMVGRRAGLSMSGVGMPGYFLVRVHGPRPVLLDPFHDGRSITKADCVRFLRGNGHQRVQHHLRDLTDREVLAHYLGGLRRTADGSAGSQARAMLRHAQATLESR